MFCIYADLCTLLAATSQFSFVIGQDMQLTGCHNGNEMRDATCADTKFQLNGPTVHSLYCASGKLNANEVKTMNKMSYL